MTTPVVREQHPRAHRKGAAKRANATGGKVGPGLELATDSRDGEIQFYVWQGRDRLRRLRYRDG